MKKLIIISIVIIVVTIAIGYGLYVLYDIVMTDVSIRLKQAISEGIQDGITSTINPLNWAQFVRSQ